MAHHGRGDWSVWGIRHFSERLLFPPLFTHSLPPPDSFTLLHPGSPALLPGTSPFPLSRQAFQLRGDADRYFCKIFWTIYQVRPYISRTRRFDIYFLRNATWMCFCHAQWTQKIQPLPSCHEGSLLFSPFRLSLRACIPPRAKQDSVYECAPDDAFFSGTKPGTRETSTTGSLCSLPMFSLFTYYLKGRPRAPWQHDVNLLLLGFCWSWTVSNCVRGTGRQI